MDIKLEYLKKTILFIVIRRLSHLNFLSPLFKWATDNNHLVSSQANKKDVADTQIPNFQYPEKQFCW